MFLPRVAVACWLEVGAVLLTGACERVALEKGLCVAGRACGVCSTGAVLCAARIGSGCWRGACEHVGRMMGRGWAGGPHWGGTGVRRLSHGWLCRVPVYIGGVKELPAWPVKCEL
jgi:hypothetical protein